MGNKSLQEKLGVHVKRVDYSIKKLVEAADNYTKEMNENYTYFFAGMLKVCIRLQFKLAEYRELKEVINAGSV
ncbi:MAG: hypothetical protein V8Q76_12830 [Bacteroides intestinalis]